MKSVLGSYTVKFVAREYELKLLISVRSTGHRPCRKYFLNNYINASCKKCSPPVTVSTDNEVICILHSLNQSVEETLFTC